MRLRVGDIASLSVVLNGELRVVGTVRVTGRSSRGYTPVADYTPAPDLTYDDELVVHRYLTMYGTPICGTWRLTLCPALTLIQEELG